MYVRYVQRERFLAILFYLCACTCCTRHAPAPAPARGVPGETNRRLLLATERVNGLLYTATRSGVLGAHVVVTLDDRMDDIAHRCPPALHDLGVRDLQSVSPSSPLDTGQVI